MTTNPRSCATRPSFARFGFIVAFLAAIGLVTLHAQLVLSQGTSNAFGESVALTFTALPPLASGSATSGPLPTVSGTAPPQYNNTNSLASASVAATRRDTMSAD
ncbi:MAG TPA: hypothetical protein VNK51_06115, partial [Bradyrhizobium sp.]|nr:hypothetical protein [Bradyrhizobium sp.]